MTWRQLVNWLSDYNFKYQNDSLCLKVGGEGDNGEEIIEALERGHPDMFLITQDNLEQVWKDIHKNNYWQYFKPFIEEIKKRYS